MVWIKGHSLDKPRSKRQIFSCSELEISMSDPKHLPPNTVRAHVLPDVEIDIDAHIRVAPPKRDWMDAVPQQYVYRCIPLLAANTMGWELLNPVDSTVTWDGGELTTSLNVASSEPNPFAAGSHFGSGMVTWYVPFLFKTSPDLGLIVTGPSNHEHNNAVPLDAFVRTDWLPFPFTMNWRITRKNTPVKFKKGEPIARVLPYPLTLLDETSLEIDALTNDPGFLAEVNEFGQARQQNVAKQQADAHRAAETGEELTGEGVWNAQYVKAKGKEGGGYAKHQTVFKSKQPKDVR
jgi:hypothetical protein